MKNSSKNSSKPLVLNKKDLDIKSEKKAKKYIPLSKRQDRPEAVLWLLKNYSQLSAGQIVKLVGSQKIQLKQLKIKAIGTHQT